MAINTRNYSWSECEIRYAGALLTSVEGVSWNVKQEKTAIYGKGNNALQINKGNITVEGSLTVLTGGLEAMLDQAPGGKLINLEDLDIQIAFVEESTGLVTRYTIIGVSFTEEPHDHKQNDPVGKATLPFLALDERRI
jgi:hypothetical protein